MSSFVLLALCLLTLSCGRSKERSKASTADGSADAGAAVRLTASLRCSECHGELHTEWRDSAHARAARSTEYLAMQKLAGAEQCDRCHAPLRAAAPKDPTAQEGVNCDVCHTMSEVTAVPAGGRFTLRLQEPEKYGPLCDAKNHYFHKMACSPLHTSSGMGAACHQMHLIGPAGDIPVYTEAEEWKASTYAGTGVECQTCHMPGEKREVAVGAGARSEVSDHRFLGEAATLRKHALGLKVTPTVTDAALDVAIELSNDKAGHAVPSGSPERRLVLRARLLAPGDDSEIAREERIFGRVLVDEQGNEVPFFRAVRVARDDRLRALEVRKILLTLATTRTGTLVIDLLWRSMPPGIANQLQVPVSPDVVLAEVRLAIKPSATKPGSLLRTVQPATMEVRP